MYWQKLKLLLTDKLPVNKYFVVGLLLRNLLLRVFLHWMCKEMSSLFFFQTGMSLEFPFQLFYSVQVNLFPSQYSLQSITFKDQVFKITIVIAAAYVNKYFSFYYKLAKTGHISFSYISFQGLFPDCTTITCNYEYVCYHIVTALDTWML